MSWTRSTRRRFAPRALCLIVGGLLLALSPALEARVRRHALIIGNNTGAPDEVRLRFAEADARKLHRVLVDIGGFHLEDSVLLLDEKATTVRRALAAISERISRPKQESMLLVYFSGHADEQRLHLGSTTLQLQELERIVRATPAKFRLIILDACRSGALTLAKGGRKRPGFKIVIDQALASQGTVFLTASAASEDAQESDRLRGSFFTHYLVSGLVGAADHNGDGKIVLEEAYRHAYENTLKESSRTLAGTQHPTFRYELSGQGQIVLTHPAGAASQGMIELPSGRSYLIIQNDRDGPVVAEVGLRDKVRAVSVRPGSYFIRGRGREAMLEGKIAVRASQRLSIEEAQLTKIAYARLVRKGSGLKSASHGVVAGYRLRTPVQNADSLCHGGFAGYALALESLSVGARLGFCRSSFADAEMSTTADEIDLEVRLSHLWDFPWLTLELGVAAGPALMRQAFLTRRIAPSRLSFGGQVGVIVGLVLDLAAGFTISADLALQTYFFELRDSQTGEDGLGAHFALKPAFALGKNW